MKQYTFDEVAPFVLLKQQIDDSEYVYWQMPNGKEVIDFNMCVAEWVRFLNDHIRERERGY